jgi:hypothetical protein
VVVDTSNRSRNERAREVEVLRELASQAHHLADELMRLSDDDGGLTASVRSAASSRPSPTRPTCSPSTPPSRRPGRVTRVVASAWSPGR